MDMPRADDDRLAVMVVDDSFSNRQMLEIFLRKLDCQVLLAENGAAAVEMFRREAPDMVLMDVMMPGMDGYEATRRIKALAGDRWVPVVFLSALDKDENLVAGLNAGGDDYLAKPTNLVVLDAKIRSFSRTLRLRRRLDENRRLKEAVLDHIDDCVITVDETGQIRSANQATFSVFNRKPEDVVGEPLALLLPEAVGTGAALLDRLAEQFAHEDLDRIRLPGRCHDGSELLLEIYVARTHIDHRQLYVVIMRDIARRAEEELRRQEHAFVLERYREDREYESRLANEIIQRSLARPGLGDEAVHYWLTPASDFSGDIVAAIRSPRGRLYAMLADATGHGLAAAISLLPVLTTFYSLAEHDYPLGFIAYEMNRQLMAFMPTGRFVAAGMVCLNPESHIADVWIGGLPGLMVVDRFGGVHEGLASLHLPLGIVDFDEEAGMIQRLKCDSGGQLVLFSDGLSEAANVDGEPFGVGRLRDALADTPMDQRLEAVTAAVTAYRQGAATHDDISLLLVDC